MLVHPDNNACFFKVFYHVMEKPASPDILYLYLFLILHYYNYNMHVEALLPENMCLDTLSNSEQCSQFERFHLEHGKMVNKTSSLKT